MLLSPRESRSAPRCIRSRLVKSPGDIFPECAADLDGDGDADEDDFFGNLDAFAAGDLAICDIDLDADDFFGYLDRFAKGC